MNSIWRKPANTPAGWTWTPEAFELMTLRNSEKVSWAEIAEELEAGDINLHVLRASFYQHRRKKSGNGKDMSKAARDLKAKIEEKGLKPDVVVRSRGQERVGDLGGRAAQWERDLEVEERVGVTKLKTEIAQMRRELEKKDQELAQLAANRDSLKRTIASLRVSEGMGGFDRGFELGLDVGEKRASDDELDQALGEAMYEVVSRELGWDGDEDA